MKKKQIFFLILLSWFSQGFGMTMPIIFVQPPIVKRAPDHLSREWLYELIEYSPSSIDTKEIRENLPYYIRMIEDDIEYLETIRNIQDQIQNKYVYNGLKKITGAALVFVSTGIACYKAISHDRCGYVEGLGPIHAVSAFLVPPACLVLGTFGAIETYVAMDYKKNLNERLQKNKHILKLLKNIQVVVQ